LCDGMTDVLYVQPLLSPSAGICVGPSRYVGLSCSFAPSLTGRSVRILHQSFLI
jgi:hypothetical protein